MSVEDPAQAASSIYGPVRSWRVGMSLGVDLLLQTSSCSFRCIYCQLGKIEQPTMQRAIFVPTEQVLADLARSPWQKADVITLSGSGEPTLALNLGEVIAKIKAMTGKPVTVLTNATLLVDPQVRREIALADQVFCKLDAPNEHLLQIIDRPVEGITMERIVEGIQALRRDYRGKLAIQTMFMPLNRAEVADLAALLKQLDPDEVQLNTPMRPVPREWFLEARGNHEAAPYPTVALKHLDREEAREIERELAALTGLKIVSVFRPADAEVTP